MADKSHSLILEALTRAAAEPSGLPLLAGKGGAGLFAAGASGKQAAARCKEAGYVHVLRQETRGKTAQEICTLSEKGLAHLLEQTNPRPVLEALVQALHACQQKNDELLAGASANAEHLRALRVVAEKVLAQCRPSASGAPLNGKHEHDLSAPLLAILRRRQEGGALDDCPLPELYRQLKADQPRLTIGQFHDLLRRLHEKLDIYLHPWTGPLYQLPEPLLALLVGHEIAYYASTRP